MPQKTYKQIILENLPKHNEEPIILRDLFEKLGLSTKMTYAGANMSKLVKEGKVECFMNATAKTKFIDHEYRLTEQL